MEPDQKGSDLAGKGCMNMLALKHTLLGGMALGGAFAGCFVAPIMAVGLHSRPKELVAKIPIAFTVSAMAGIVFTGAVVPW